MAHQILRPATLELKVRAHAIEHYAEDGWDVIVEATTQEELLELIGRCYTLEGAIKKVHEYCKGHKAYGDEIRAEVF